MSNYVPPTTPIGGPTGQPIPQPTYPPPPKKKSNLVVWVLAGCGTFVVLGVVAVMALSYFVWNKAKEFEKNPAFEVAKIMVSANPDVELVSADEEKGLITIKDKKSGEVFTVNLDDVENGKLTFKKDGEEEALTFEAKGDDSKGSLEVKSAEGAARFGSGAVDKPPDWLPAYPGSEPEGSYSAQSQEGASGGFNFFTMDAPNKVISFYEESLERAGLTVTTNIMQQSGKPTGGFASGEDSNQKRTAYITAAAGEDGTRVNVVFTIKP